jgi:hypothetical protein
VARPSAGAARFRRACSGACLALSVALAACRPAVERPSLAAKRAAPAGDGSPAPPEQTPTGDGEHRLAIGASQLRVRLDPKAFAGREAAVLGWVERCARAVAGYYGAFPVPRLTIEVRAAGGAGIRGAQTFPSSPPRIAINVSERASAGDFERNWSMTHEMVHLAFPNVPPAQHWIEEGLATFVEPIARARAGWITEDAVWAEWIESMPLGLPGPGDGGLDGTQSWGRIYWGGALFCLVAAVALLERTDGRQGLDDALRAIVGAGGNISERWPLERALGAGDAATGASVLLDTYTAMKDESVSVDLDALWLRLGVARQAGRIRYDDGAPLASVRRALVSGVEASRRELPPTRAGRHRPGDVAPAATRHASRLDRALAPPSGCRQSSKRILPMRDHNASRCSCPHPPTAARG